MRAVAQHLLPKGERLRALVDCDDVTQAAWKSVVVALRGGQVFATSDDFGRYVARVVENQVSREYRDHVSCLKRSLKREQSLDQHKHDAAGSEKDPAEDAAWRDDVRQFTDNLTARQRRVLIALLSGEALAETAASMGISERTLERVAAELRRRWRERAGAGTQPVDS
jgi:RNA polymerase sigma factor (sigma-70 family)